VARFSVAIQGYVDTTARFVLITGSVAYQDILTRFIQTIQVTTDVLTRFCVAILGYTDINSRFGQAVLYFIDIQTIFYLSISTWTNTRTRYILDFYSHADAFTLFSTRSETVSRDAFTRFRLTLPAFHSWNINRGSLELVTVDLE
jgi:hypothetical protein